MVFYLLLARPQAEHERLRQKRFENYKKQPLEFVFDKSFTGKLSQFGLNPDRRTPTGIKAAIIREKGTNGEREMAYMLYLAGFDVKDVTMTDLVSGRETLEDINFIVFCGGFSNSDVLGSAKDGPELSCSIPKPKLHWITSMHAKIHCHWAYVTAAS